jgi:hypothetical protein
MKKVQVEYKVREYYPNGEVYSTIRTAYFASEDKAAKFVAKLSKQASK